MTTHPYFDDLLAWGVDVIIEKPFSVLEWAGSMGMLLLPGAVCGLILGVIQAAYLYNRAVIRSRPYLWVAATVVGMALGWAYGELEAQYNLIITYRLAYPYEDAQLLVHGVIVGGLIGLVVGSCQWLVLRRHSSRAYLWPMGSAAIWAIGLTAYQAAYAVKADRLWLQSFNERQDSHVTGWVVGGLILGTLTLLLAEALAPARLSHHEVKIQEMKGSSV